MATLHEVFMAFLDDELDRRDMTVAEFSRLGEVPAQTVSDWRADPPRSMVTALMFDRSLAALRMDAATALKAMSYHARQIQLREGTEPVVEQDGDGRVMRPGRGPKR